MLRLVVATQPTQQQILDYVNDTALVSAYVYALVKTELPVLAFPPSWYADYTEKLAIAQVHALNWINGVVPSLQTIPGSIINFNAALQQNLTSLTENLQALKQDPNNSQYRQAVVSVLQQLQTEVQAAQSAVQGLEQVMNDFSAQLQPDAQTLSDMASQSASAVNADAAMVQKLNASIQTLQDAITAENQLVKYENLVKADLGIFLVVVAATIGWAGGPVVEGIIGMAAMGLLSGIGDKLASEPNIKGYQDEISNVQQEIGGINTEIAILQNIATSFTQLLTANTKAQQSLAAVIAMWDTPDSDLTAMINDFSEISNDLTADMLDDAIQSAQYAASSWNDLESFVTQINGIQYNFDPSVHVISGSSTQTSTGASSASK